MMEVGWWTGGRSEGKGGFRTLRWVDVLCGPLCVAGVVVWPVERVYFLTRWGGCKEGRKKAN